MSDLISFGELLIDFTPAGEKDGRKLFMQNAGGAVANVAVGVARLGISSAYTGMVGNDAFGHYLKDVLIRYGVDVSRLIMTDDYNTTLAIVHLFDNGDRDFTFYRKPGADIMFTADMLDEQQIKQARVFHFGSLSMTDEPARSATLRALEIAKSAGATISYDPNYRAPLWRSKQEAKENMLRGLDYADILKISDNEAEFMFGSMPPMDAAKMLVSRGLKLVFVTMGAEGAVYANTKGAGHSKTFDAIRVDATGAGDCFTAGVLYGYLKKGKSLESLTLDDISGFARFANAAASVCVESKGGIPSMPTLEQVQSKLAGR